MNIKKQSHPGLLTISETVELTGLSLSTLRRWDALGTLKSFRKSPHGNRYYHRVDIDNYLLQKQDISTLAKQWVQNKTAVELSETFYCQTRDVFSVRLERLQNELSKAASSQAHDDLISVIIAMAGEIGNNSFDHNLGNWPDIPGIFFGYNSKLNQLILADRGRGILTTLKQVRPMLKKDAQALKVAFTETISGRAPEARGNGLKFVRKIVTNNPIKLWFLSGSAELHLKQGDEKLHIREISPTVRGCLAIIKY
ncbi:MerR family transcriptional regulator [Patescibacteria group bacterium]|nr:MerR family transcriptional regulator [Patescibacteria group bacterium]